MFSLPLVSFLEEKYKSQGGYGLQKETEAYMDYILRNMLLSKLPEHKAEIKNSEDSICYRKEGNQCYVAGDIVKAIEYYTKSLAYADNKQLMTYAYANRSAALYRLKMFKECLMDVDAALSLGYYGDKPKQLQERKVKALAKIQKTLKIEKSSPKTVNTTRNTSEEKGSKSNGKETKLIYPTKEDCMCKTVMTETKDTKKPQYIVDEGQPKLLYGPSKEAPAASDGVKIVFSKEYGRHLVATKDFNPGDIISMEEPYMLLINEERFYTHCHHCLTRSYNLIPCPGCPFAQYCSEGCRKTAWDSVHNIECRIWVLLENALGDLTSCRIIMKPLRILITLTKGGKEIKELREDMMIAESNTDKRTAGFSDEGLFDSSSARSVLSLATNMTRLLDRLCGNARICAIATVLLATQTTFFGKQLLVENLIFSDIFPDLTFCGALLHRGIWIISTNNFAIQPLNTIRAGYGIYVVHSLYNHSCEPNAFWHFDGVKIITRARSPMRPGEQIFVSYGSYRVTLPTQTRLMTIAMFFFFQCKCRACVENWPTYVEILEHRIGSIVHMENGLKLFTRLMPLYSRLWNNEYDIKAIKAGLKILNAEMTNPCVEILEFENFLINYYKSKLESLFLSRVVQLVSYLEP